MLTDPVFETIATQERRIVLASVAAVAIVGVLATLQTGDMLMMTTANELGTLAYAMLMFLMWWTMMMAMMLPSAAPAILTYGALSRKFSEKGANVAPISIFAAGYAIVWTGFSLAAVALQLLFAEVIEMTMMMAVTSATLGGGLLVAAGLYQLSPLKAACLRNCQSPLMFLGRNWQSGYRGALRMGLMHGLYCLGCCWVLMGLLFYGGVMELRWIVGLALYVAAEKLIPAGNRLSQFTGVFLLGWGGWIIFDALT